MTKDKVTAYLALGSNLGDRHDYLERALHALKENPRIEVTQVSSFYETAPVGGPAGQGDYLNAAAELKTDLSAKDLLEVMLAVERSLGRARGERHGPRTIDLDLLLYGDLVHSEPGLTLPHPAMQERYFVLKPLAEIAPRVIHPVLGQTIVSLLAKLPPPLPSSPSVSPPEAGGRYRGGEGPAGGLSGRKAVAGPANKELAGLRALVTGSTSGIGRAMALELAAGGADVIIHGRRADAAKGVADRIGENAGRTQVVLANLPNPDECHRLLQTAWKEWGGLDIWINNAGADTLTGEAANWPFERKLEELLAVDLKATIWLSREVGQRMKARGSGVILNMGWDQADTGMEGDSGQMFGATKAAVMAFSKSLALTLAPEVRVNCLAPGWIRTAWGENASQRWQERVKRETLLGRWGTPEDVARVARWLVSPAAAFITGQIIRINGGAVR